MIGRQKPAGKGAPDSCPPEPAVLAAGVPEQAWKIFDTINGKIEHADVKAGSILAACGVTAAAILSLIASRKNWDPIAIVSAGLTAALAFAAAGFACAALWPRRRAAEQPTSLLYFDHIARRQGETAAQYGEALLSLLIHPDALTTGIAEQIWATAQVAARKYHWIDRAMASLFGSLVTLGITGVSLALAHSVH